MAEQKKSLKTTRKCKENRGSAGKRAEGQKAEDCNVQATLKAYCLDKKMNNHDRVVAEGRCKYIELYSVFNDKQLFLNVQDSLSPLQIIRF